MKRIIPVASIVLTGLAAHGVYAEQPHGFIDYRHEYLDKKEPMLTALSSGPSLVTVLG